MPLNKEMQMIFLQDFKKRMIQIRISKMIKREIINKVIINSNDYISIKGERID